MQTICLTLLRYVTISALVVFVFVVFVVVGRIYRWSLLFEAKKKALIIKRTRREEAVDFDRRQNILLI